MEQRLITELKDLMIMAFCVTLFDLKVIREPERAFICLSELPYRREYKIVLSVKNHLLVLAHPEHNLR